MAPEHDFAILDRLLSQKPNATYIALESLLLYSQNRTSEWLKSKSESEERLLSAAQSLTSVHKANFKKRREEIYLRRLEHQREKEREKQRKLVKIIQEKEDLTKRLAPFGYGRVLVKLIMDCTKSETRKIKLKH